MTPNLFEDIEHPASAEHWTDKVSSISVFRSGDRRAPYKPLLLLWAIGRLAAGNTGPVYFRDAEDDLIRLMDKHRLGNKVRVVFPFVYMGADPDLWRVETEDGSNVAKMPQSQEGEQTVSQGRGKGWVSSRLRPGAWEIRRSVPGWSILCWQMSFPNPCTRKYSKK